MSCCIVLYCIVNWPACCLVEERTENTTTTMTTNEQFTNKIYSSSNTFSSFVLLSSCVYGGVGEERPTKHIVLNWSHLKESGVCSWPTGRTSTNCSSTATSGWDSAEPPPVWLQLGRDKTRGSGNEDYLLTMLASLIQACQTSANQQPHHSLRPGCLGHSVHWICKVGCSVLLLSF